MVSSGVAFNAKGKLRRTFVAVANRRVHGGAEADQDDEPEGDEEGRLPPRKGVAHVRILDQPRFDRSQRPHVRIRDEFRRRAIFRCRRWFATSEADLLVQRDVEPRARHGCHRLRACVGSASSFAFGRGSNKQAGR